MASPAERLVTKFAHNMFLPPPPDNSDGVSVDGLPPPLQRRGILPRPPCLPRRENAEKHLHSFFFLS
jgi:hypothetical protein